MKCFIRSHFYFFSYANEHTSVSFIFLSAFIGCHLIIGVVLDSSFVDEHLACVQVLFYK